MPGWLSWLSTWLWLRSQSHGLWIRVPCQALCWQLRAWSLLRILCVPLSLPLPCSFSVSLCLSIINKCLKNLKKLIQNNVYFQQGEILTIYFFIKTILVNSYVKWFVCVCQHMHWMFRYTSQWFPGGIIVTIFPSGDNLVSSYQLPILLWHSKKNSD